MYWFAMQKTGEKGHAAPAARGGSRTTSIAILVALVVQVSVVWYVMYRPSMARERAFASEGGSGLSVLSIKKATENRLASMAALARQVQALPSPAPPPPPAAAAHAPAPGRRKKKKVDPWITRETCHILNDDSELCQYDGPICVSQSDSAEFVFVSSPPADHGEAE